MSSIDQFLTELADRRTQLADERDRLTDLIEQVDAILIQYRQELKHRSGAKAPAAKSDKSDKDALRAELVRRCKEAYPNGLTTEELYDIILPEWPDVSQRRIGTLAVHTAELAGSGGGPYYYVPAEGETVTEAGDE